MHIWEIALRIGLSMIVGGAIGVQREFKKGNSAGLRTHMLVALGACIAMMTNEYLLLRWGDSSSIDISRMAAYVISGIGFLGAGSIIKDGERVRGLTTAAGLWVVACLGITAGAGFYWATGVGGAMVIIVMTLLKAFERRVIKKKNRTVITLKLPNKPGELASALNVLSELRLGVKNIDMEETDEEMVLATIITSLPHRSVAKLTKEIEKSKKIKVVSIELN